jgi:very-short-patch-repair endonuclease
MTEAEKVMWRLLRSRQLAGFKFRRQQPIRRYVVDFVCFSHALIVEIDGGQHADSESDEIRSHLLAREGFRLLRFWNNEVMENQGGVCARILEVLDSRTPHPPVASRRAPPPPPRGEGM